MKNLKIPQEIDETQSVYFSNRARCYKILKELEKAYKDSIQAIELDDKNIKAHLLCGQTLVELGKNQKGTENIETAISKMTKGDIEFKIFVKIDNFLGFDKL